MEVQQCLICENADENTENFIEIHKTQFIDVFLQLSGLKMITNTDFVCSTCLKDLTICQAFQQKCLKSSTIVERRKNSLPTVVFFRDSFVDNKAKSEPETKKLKTELFSDDDSTTFPTPCCSGTSKITAVELPKEPQSKSRDYLCKHCGTNIFGFAKYSSHTLSHEKLPNPFQCSICGISMRFKRNMAEHMMIHSGATPHKCNLCTQGFRTSSMLARHILFHENRRRWSCPYCPLRFNLLSTRNFHVDSVHLKKAKYTCSECSATFLHSRWFRIHTKTHNGGKDLSCKSCDQKFYFIADLKQHTRKKHPIEPEEDSIQDSEMGDTI